MTCLSALSVPLRCGWHCDVASCLCHVGPTGLLMDQSGAEVVEGSRVVVVRWLYGFHAGVGAVDPKSPVG